MLVEHDQKEIFDKIISNFFQLLYVDVVYVKQLVVVYHLNYVLNLFHQNLNYQLKKIYYFVLILNSNVEMHVEHDFQVF